MPAASDARHFHMVNECVLKEALEEDWRPGGSRYSDRFLAEIVIEAKNSPPRRKQDVGSF